MIIHEIDIHLEPRNQSNPKQSSCSGDRISGTSGTGETINLSQALLVLNCSKLLYSGWVNAFCLHLVGFKVKIWLHRFFPNLNTLFAHWYVKSIVIHASISIICIHICVGSHFDPQRHSEWKSSLSLPMWKPWLVQQSRSQTAIALDYRVFFRSLLNIHLFQLPGNIFFVIHLENKSRVKGVCLKYLRS